MTSSPETPNVERHENDPACVGQWCCGCAEHPAGKPWGWNHEAWNRHFEDAHACGPQPANETTLEVSGETAKDWATRRMLEALDAYWLHCDGLPKGRYPRGRYDLEDWWNRFEGFRRQVETALVRGGEGGEQAEG